MPAPQLTLFETGTDRQREARSGSFVDNMQLPVHRWFRYSAGFSAQWARELIEERRKASGLHVLDPFAGSGTVLLASERGGVEAIGIEAHPFVARVAKTKLAWREDVTKFRRLAMRIVENARQSGGSAEGYPPLIGKCFPANSLRRLDALRTAWTAIDDGSQSAELCWLVLASILRPCSPVGTAQWQYVLPRKSKARSIDPFDAFEAQVEVMSADMAAVQRTWKGPGAVVIQDDARKCRGVSDEWSDLVLTSPPYANNYDYADATRLEMCFFGEIQGWGDLQAAVRERLVRACTQHVAPYAEQSMPLIGSELLAPIEREIRDVCTRLEAERENHGGKKPYHAMVAFYFHDLAQVWQSLRRVTRRGGAVCFVIGDSAPYGIYVPVDRWLGELALAAGFKSYRFEKLRDRNTKWKNRKHRVPLHEGRLWVEG
jgi:hypothetical protein